GDGKAHHGRRTDSSETDAAFAEERITADTELSQEEVVGAPEEGAVRQKGEDPRNEHRQGEPTGRTGRVRNPDPAERNEGAEQHHRRERHPNGELRRRPPPQT